MRDTGDILICIEGTLFYKAGYIEARGRGIDKIISFGDTQINDTQEEIIRLIKDNNKISAVSIADR